MERFFVFFDAPLFTTDRRYYLYQPTGWTMRSSSSPSSSPPPTYYLYHVIHVIEDCSCVHVCVCACISVCVCVCVVNPQCTMRSQRGCTVYECTNSSTNSPTNTFMYIHQPTVWTMRS